MSELFDKAIAKISQLPPGIQDDVARVMLAYIGSDDPGIVRLTAEEHAALELSEQAADRGEFATDKQLRAVFDKYRV